MIDRRHMLILLERVLDDLLRSDVKYPNKILKQISFITSEDAANRL